MSEAALVTVVALIGWLALTVTHGLVQMPALAIAKHVLIWLVILGIAELAFDTIGHA